jgi:hypothetical protein
LPICPRPINPIFFITMLAFPLVPPCCLSIRFHHFSILAAMICSNPAHFRQSRYPNSCRSGSRLL